METIFITGATGFIGNAILRQLAAGNVSILAMSRNRQQDLALQTLGAIPIRCNLETITEEMLKNVATVIHAAGAVGPHSTSEQFLHTNTSGTKHVFDLAAKAGVKQFVYISSDIVVLNTNNQIGITEDAPYSDLKHPYVMSKVAAEKYLFDKMNSVAMKTVCLRPRLVWGPGDRTQLPLMHKAVLSGKFWWINNGSSLTSTTYIGNLTNAVSLIVGNMSIASGAYFIGDAAPHTHKVFWTSLLHTMKMEMPSKSLPGWFVLPMARVMEKIFSWIAPSKKAPISVFTVAVFGTSFTMNCNKAFEVFGYTPVFSFEQGLATLPSEY